VSSIVGSVHVSKLSVAEVAAAMPPKSGTGARTATSLPDLRYASRPMLGPVHDTWRVDIWKNENEITIGRCITLPKR